MDVATAGCGFFFGHEVDATPLSLKRSISALWRKVYSLKNSCLWSASWPQRKVQAMINMNNSGEPCSRDTDDMLSEPDCETLSHEASSTVSESQGCDADCCNLSRDKPNQPTAEDILASTKRIQGSQARYVQSSWFKQHTWLTLRTRKQNCFAFLV